MSRMPWNTSGMAREPLYPFRFYDPLRKRWIQARYKASREEIAARYEKWEVTGPGWTPSDVDGRTCRSLEEK